MQRHWYFAGWTLLAAVFGVLAVTLTWLFAVGAAACFVIGFGVERGILSRARFAEALPFTVTWKERSTEARPPPPLGVLDLEVAFDREGKFFRRALDRISIEVAAVGQLMERYGPRFTAAKDLPVHQKVSLSQEFAGKVRPHAKRMRSAEKDLRVSTKGFTESYLKRIQAYPPELDLGPIRPALDSLLTTSTQSRGQMKGYRDALVVQRKINLQQAVNEVLDQLIETADGVLQDVDTSIAMVEDALAEVDTRRSTTGVNRAARRRRARS